MSMGAMGFGRAFWTFFISLANNNGRTIERKTRTSNVFFSLIKRELVLLYVEPLPNAKCRWTRRRNLPSPRFERNSNEISSRLRNVCLSWSISRSVTNDAERVRFFLVVCIYFCCVCSDKRMLLRTRLQIRNHIVIRQLVQTIRIALTNHRRTDVFQFIAQLFQIQIVNVGILFLQLSNLRLVCIGTVDDHAGRIRFFSDLGHVRTSIEMIQSANVNNFQRMFQLR